MTYNPDRAPDAGSAILLRSLYALCYNSYSLVAFSVPYCQAKLYIAYADHTFPYTL